MKTPYVSELQPNQIITATLVVQNKEIRQKKTGEPYLSLLLGDRTGDIEARMWDNVADVMDTFDRDDFLRVRGLLQVHHNRLQITIHKLQRQPEEGIDFTDYFPASERNPDEMYAELRAVVASIGNSHLQALTSAMIEDPEIARRLRIAPAAKNVHHAYLGGLLEHVLSMCGLARLTAMHYRNIDVDLLLAGVVLHDLGKIHELTYDRSFGYSNDGQLLGHIYIGLRMMDEKLRQMPEFPGRLRTLLEHMILSHHGQMEYGSPKVPVFPEALLLHHIDNLDSKMECMRALAQKDRHVEGCWTGYSATLERSVLKKREYLEESKPMAVRAQEATASVSPGGAASNPPQPPVAQVPEARRPFHQSLFGEKLLGALRRHE
jgi:3'-5' exoribonuclease